MRDYCSKHTTIEMQCLGGRSAHETNWFCPKCVEESEIVINPPKIDPYDNEILNERETTYGSYTDGAVIAQSFKTVMHNAPSWDNLPPPMKESLEIIATKIGRILNGDPFYKDSWDDIAGYAQLISTILDVD